MTILNVSLLGDRALVATDVMGGDESGARQQEFSKLFPLVQSNCVVGGRGYTLLTALVFVALVAQPDSSYDSMAETFPAVVTTAYEQTRAALLEHGGAANDPEIDGSHAVCLVGWSAARKSMCGVRMTIAPGQTEFVQSEIDRWTLAPGEPYASTMNPPEQPATVDDMVATSNAQCAWWRSTLPALPIGRRLIVAELTRDSMCVTSRTLS